MTSAASETVRALLLGQNRALSGAHQVAERANQQASVVPDRHGIERSRDVRDKGSRLLSPTSRKPERLPVRRRHARGTRGSLDIDRALGPYSVSLTSENVRVVRAGRSIVVTLKGRDKQVGAGLHPRNVTRVLDGLLTAAKLPHVRFHDLRHSAASLLLAQGVDIVAISKLLGHSELRVTADLYAHLQKQTAAKAASIMDAVLNG